MPEATDTIAHVAADTLPDPASMHIIMTRPRSETPRGTSVQDDTGASSWVILALVILFVLVAGRFHGNIRFTGSLLRELTEGPGRKTMFDDTMRETTFMTMLNLLTIASGGVILWQFTGCHFMPDVLHGPEMLFNLGVCCALVAGLYLCRRGICWAIGRIFSTPELTRGWMRSYSASTGLLCFILFPLALTGMFYPSGLSLLLIPSLVAYALSRVLFSIKGYRIFSAERVSYIGFLYYLCSVEIIPVVFTCVAATHLCRP